MLTARLGSGGARCPVGAASGGGPGLLYYYYYEEPLEVVTHRSHGRGRGRRWRTSGGGSGACCRQRCLGSRSHAAGTAPRDPPPWGSHGVTRHHTAPHGITRHHTASHGITRHHTLTRSRYCSEAPATLRVTSTVNLMPMVFIFSTFFSKHSTWKTMLD